MHALFVVFSCFVRASMLFFRISEHARADTNRPTISPRASPSTHTSKVASRARDAKAVAMDKNQDDRDEGGDFSWATNETLWEIVFRWLNDDPKVLFSAAKVCKTWNKLVCTKDTDACNWKKICSDTNPELTKAFLSVQENWDMRRLTIQLQGFPFVPRQLREEHIFAVVELYRWVNRRRLSVASFGCRPMKFHSTHCLFRHDAIKVIEGGNPLATSPVYAAKEVLKDFDRDDEDADPVLFARKDAIGPWYPNILRAKVVLFRSDTEQSLLILDRMFNPRIEMQDYFEEQGCETTDYVELTTQDYQIGSGLALAKNSEGEKARKMFEAHGAKPDNALECCASLDVVHHPGKAPPGSDDEPLWLAEMREGRFGFSAGAQAALAEIPTFQFGLQNFRLFFKATGADGYFNGIDEMLVALEGLEWH